MRLLIRAGRQQFNAAALNCFLLGTQTNRSFSLYSSALVATPFTCAGPSPEAVDDASFPTYPTAGHLPELLSSVGTQPLRCVAVAPQGGHTALAVANGTYLHVLSARASGSGSGGSGGDGGAGAAASSGGAVDLDALRAALGSSTEHLGGGLDAGDSHLSFHGVSPVAALEFVPSDVASARPLCLLAIQEDGAVAAWAWASGTAAGGLPRWAPMAEAPFAGGAPIVLPPLPGMRTHGAVAAAALTVTPAAEDDYDAWVGRCRLTLSNPR